jgi:hypothetical protein
MAYKGGPGQIEPPVAVLDCWPEPGHGHVDLVYYLQETAGYPGKSHDPEDPIVWLTIADLQRGGAQTNGAFVRFPPDVQALAVDAIRRAQTVRPPVQAS